MKKFFNQEKIVFDDESFRIFALTDTKPVVIADSSDAASCFHEQVEIKYFYDGQSTLIVGDETVTAKKGDVVVVNPYEFHGTLYVGDGKYYLLMLDAGFFGGQGFDGVDLRAVFMEKKTMFTHCISGDARLGKIVEDVVCELSSKEDNYKMVVTCLMAEFFALLMRSYAFSGVAPVYAPKTIRRYESIEPAIRKIMADYGQPLTIDGLSGLCNMCKYYFCRVFRETMGMTAMEYLLEYRLKNADVLLKNTKMTISEIACECGFYDGAYFSRCYKRSRGFSPGECRRKCRKEEI